MIQDGLGLGDWLGERTGPILAVTASVMSDMVRVRSLIVKTYSG